MIAKAAYLLVFLGGLALAVHVMLHGVERWRPRCSPRPSAVLNPPTVAALAVGVGASCYLLSSRSSLSHIAIFSISFLVGGAALAGMIVLMAKFFRRPVNKRAINTGKRMVRYWSESKVIKKRYLTL